MYIQETIHRIHAFKTIQEYTHSIKKDGFKINNAMADLTFSQSCGIIPNKSKGIEIFQTLQTRFII